MTDSAEPMDRAAPSSTGAGANGRSTAERWFAVALLALVGVALLVRLVYTIGVSDDLAFTGDAETYHLLAQRIADGDGYVRPQGDLAGTPTAEFPPLFPVVLALVDAVGGDSVLTQKVFTSVLGSATVVLIGLVGRRVRGASVGLVAAAIAAVYPMLFQVDGALVAESLYALLVSAFLLAIYRAIDGQSMRDWLIAGVLIGLAALTRTEGALLLLVVAVPESLRRGGDTPRHRWRALGLCALASAVIVMPWIVRNAVAFDRFIPISNNSGTLVAGANCERSYFGQYRGVWRFECVTDIDVAGLDEAAAADRFREVGIEYARDHTGQVPRVVTTRVLRTFGLFEPKEQMDWESFEGRSITWQVAGHRMFLVLVPLAVGGVVLLWRGRRAFWPLVAPVLVVVVTTAASYGNQRFRVGAEPGIIVLAAVGLVAAANWAKRSVSARAHDT